MQAMHFITRDVNGQRMRYFGGFTDERFESLPYIKERGRLPKGWHAYHLTAEEMQARSGPRFVAVNAFPVLDARAWNAVPDLTLALRQDQDEEQMRPCSIDDHGGEDRTVMGNRVTGRRWSEQYQRSIVFSGYVCDMHAEEIEGLRWR
jgi:hypothetical protein